MPTLARQNVSFYGSVRKIPPHFWADGSVRPQDALVFYGDFGEFAAPQRADVGIGPYDQVGKCIRIRRMAVAFCRRLPLDLLLGKKNA